MTYDSNAWYAKYSTSGKFDMSLEDLKNWVNTYGTDAQKAQVKTWGNKTAQQLWKPNSRSGIKEIFRAAQEWIKDSDNGNKFSYSSSKWNWNPTVPQPTTETVSQPAETPKWNSNPYNFTANDIRNFGSVENIYNQYAAAAANKDFGNGYLGYLHDRYGSSWGNKLNRQAFENTLRESEGMNGGIRGRDYKQGFDSYQTWLADRNANHANEVYKTGGKIMNYYQDGGTVQDPQQQVIALVQAAAQGDEQAQQTIQQIQQAAEKGDQQAVQLMQLIQQVVEQMQGQQAQAAKFGAKLAYIKHLKGECPKGTHLEYFKAGGQICKKCAQDAIKKDCKGSKIKKACGGATAGMNLIKAELKKKVVSAKDGDDLPTAPDASEAYKGGVYTADSRNILQKLFSSDKISTVSSNPRLHQFPRVITQIISGKDTTYTEVPATDSQDTRTKTRKASTKDADFRIMKRRFQQAVSAATQKK